MCFPQAWHRRVALTFVITIGLLLCVPPPASAQETSSVPAVGPSLVFDSVSIDVGESYQFGVVEHEFRFTNDGGRPVRILDLEPGDPQATAKSTPELLEPGEAGVIRVVQPLGQRLGVDHYRYVVRTDDSEQPEYVLDLYTFVQSAYDVEHPLAVFGDVDAATGKRLEFDVSTREAPSLDFVRLVDAPPFVSVDPDAVSGDSPQTLELEIEIGPDAPIGDLSGLIHVQTDLEHQRDYVIRFQANVFGDVVPSPHPISWGAVRQGDSRELIVRLDSRSGSPIRVERVEDASARVEATSTACGTEVAVPDACRLLRLALRTDRQGGFRGQLNVFLAGTAEPLPLSYSGLVAAPDARIQDLGILDGKTRVERSVTEREREP